MTTTSLPKILIVDDEADSRNLLAAALRLSGLYECETAEDGAAAFALMASFRPDLVVLDLFLPKINGWQWLDAKAKGKYATVPVVILSGWTELPLPIPDNAGVVNILPKGSALPVILELLTAALKSGRH